MLIDSHCHLHDEEFFNAAQAEEMLLRAKERDVKKIICIGTSHDDSLAAADFSNNHDDVYWTYGIHPEGANNTNATREAFSLNGLPSNISKPVAIGEIGLDYHYEGYNREVQIKLFEEMLQLAQNSDLPVSFHVREAYADFFPIVQNFPKVRGVVHSFTDSKKVLKRILDETDYYVGVNGLATYSTLPTPPIDRILLETDAPFLTPKPFRGIINEPAYVPEIATWLSEKLGLEFKIIEEKTTKNARRLFNI